ncbi:MAG: DUF11 domain-containing protein, partial [Anaerolineae bacterium]|nr:DUF11 domain-containing protein [Anaerolineae bacterium]
GEVEDYLVQVLEMDYGDAPDINYATVYTSDGARHIILPANNPTLGSIVDAEIDGQPNVLANGDDTNGIPDDEDGVVFDSDLVPGEVATITVTAAPTATGVLNAWIDFGSDGDWNDTNDQVVTNQVIAAGTSVVITFTVPSTATQSATYARFRFSTDADLAPTGLASDGEIEDYLVGVLELDYGDLPDSNVPATSGYATPTYPTTNADNGARHIILPVNNPTLGSTVDAELDGQPSLNADGDDTNGIPDDEDGVAFSGPLVPGETLVITVTAAPTATGVLNAWIDFDGNGVLNDVGEQVALNETITAGTSITLAIGVPLTATQGITTYARFRFSTDRDLQPTGLANDGEIQDYAIPTVELDFGDLPEGPYPTTRAQDGARHIIITQANPTLGSFVDAEVDGQPNGTAAGDDNASTPDDEDGVRLDSVIVAGQIATITITGTNVVSAYLNAWIDFDGNGVLTDAGEQIFTDTVLSAGANVLTFTVPVVVLSDTLNARFRYSTDSGLTPTGLASDGEIEDHRFTPVLVEYGDLPEGAGLYPTTLGADGARHVVDGVTYLGSTIDAESDGQPSLAADGDDLAGASDDEDGIVFLTPIMRGQTAQIQVTAASAGYLNAWIDLDFDGTLDVIDTIALDGAPVVSTVNDLYLDAGTHTLVISVPNVTIGSSVYSRFRFTSYDTNGTLSYTGLANDGEVEDYVLMSLGNVVWLDMGGGAGGIVNDGAMNGSEAGIAGVVVELYRSGQMPGVDTPVVTTTTDAGGYYTFTGLVSDTYVVHIPASEFHTGEPFEGLFSSTGSGVPDDDLDQDRDENGIDDDAPAINGISGNPVTLSLGTEPVFEDGDTNSNLTIDFGFIVAASLGDYVWFDWDVDGIQDPGEPGVPGVTVTLYTTAGVPISTTTTDASGYYSFTNLQPGGYYLDFTPPPTYTLTYQDQGGDDAADSDADPITGRTISTTLEPGEHDPTWDAGLYLVPGIDVVKTVSVDCAANRMPFTYTIRITNTGQAILDPLVLTDTLPPDFYYTAGSSTPVVSNVVDGPPTVLVWQDLGILAPGESLTVTFGVTATPAITGTYVNEATGKGTHPGGIITDTDDVPVAIQDPSIALDKAAIDWNTDDLAPNYVTFTIRITNTGPSPIDVLPMLDQYDPAYLSFEWADPLPDEPDDDGILTWYDLTAAGLNGLGRNMMPGETFVVTTVFRIVQDVITTTNVATVTNVLDEYDNPSDDKNDDQEISNVTTFVDLLYFRATSLPDAVLVEWETAVEIDNYGFYLFRDTGEELESADEIAFLPATGHRQGAGAAYQFKDLAVQADIYYTYWLVDIDVNGQRTTHGPVSVTTLSQYETPWHIYLPIVVR